MSMNVNTATVVGRLTKEIELREAGKSKVANFTLAVNRNYKNKDGNYDADFIDCAAWGATAEFLEKYAVKGQEIGVTGPIETDTYTDKDGHKRTRWTVRANTVNLGNKPNGAANTAAADDEDADAIPFG